MPVLAQTRARTRALGTHGTLMARCLAVGLPVASACSGRGACGKCVLRILEGADALSPVDIHERLVLERNDAAPGERLGCQARVEDVLSRIVVSTGYW
ncbi:MAG TPA: 2Fe-2S iron-sulfur cluster-binding protein [Holophagaceae bacterium]|nr:2Fe-2S iron-sulfur cluster-binding protein [Holophagaceae bacterium]